METANFWGMGCIPNNRGAQGLFLTQIENNFWIHFFKRLTTDFRGRFSKKYRLP